MSLEKSEFDDKGWYYYLITNSNIIYKGLKPQEIIKLPKMDEKDNFTFCFTHPYNESKRSLFNQIKRIINEAIDENRYLLLCSFYLNNSEIIELIKSASSKLEGKLYVIVGNKIHSYISFNTDLEIVREGISSLAKYGVLIRYVENSHLKFITNGKSSLICTTNMTTEGLFRNPEFGLAFDEESVAIALNRIFFYLWFKKSDFFLINESWIKIPESIKKFPESYNQKKKDFFNNSDIILNSNTLIQELNRGNNLVNKENTYEIIYRIVSSAKKSIDIAIYNLYLSSDDKLEKLRDLLIEKAKDSVNVRILVPSVKVNFYSVEMKKQLDEIKKQQISIHYYRELHGKCVIIDKELAMIMTGNIDSYLINKNSFDIAFKLKNSSIVNNVVALYEHLWSEAADECDIDNIINLHLDLTIRSYEFISFKPLISVKKLEKIIDDCESIRLYLHQSGSLLTISSETKNKRLNIYFDQKSKKSSEFTGDFLNLEGLIKDSPSMNIKEAINFSVKTLDLRLLWHY